MRRNLMVRTIVLTAALSVLSASAATAQLGELAPTPRPVQFKGIRTAVVSSALDDPAIGSIIEAAAFEAHEAIGGIKKRFSANTLPDARTVSNAARNLGKTEDEGNDVIVVSGGNKQTTVDSAGLNFNSVFIDIGQSRPCVTRDGRPDPSGTCAGGAEGIPFNYSAVGFAVDEGAYLAGIVAASASPNDRIGIISGQPSCEECARYIEAFTLGAQSVKPSIELTTSFLADDGVDAVLADSSTGKTYAEAFIKVHQPDVILPLARASSLGIVEAACEAGIRAIATDIDMATTY
ncbi:MAG: BMP family ABC transporter substrate-binding protein, partial [Chloroflexota bacterium]